MGRDSRHPKRAAEAQSYIRKSCPGRVLGHPGRSEVMSEKNVVNLKLRSMCHVRTSEVRQRLPRYNVEHTFFPADRLHP